MTPFIPAPAISRVPAAKMPGMFDEDFDESKAFEGRKKRKEAPLEAQAPF